MSESLMDTAVPETDTQPPAGTTEEGTTEVEGWSWSEGVAGDGERPEWFQDKYKSVAEQAAAYPELAKKFGGFTGAPEEYLVAPPEGEDGTPVVEYASDDPMVASFKETAKDLNMSQEGFTKLLQWYTNTQIDQQESQRAMEIERLGDNRETRIRDVQDWGKANLSEDEFAMLENTLTTADSFKLVEMLIDKTREKSIPADVKTSPGITEAELQAMVADPRYSTNEGGFRDKYEALARKFYGNSEHREVRG